MMLHAAVHWPEKADPSLWPMAVAHAVYLYSNHVPQPELGICLADLFTCTQWEQHKFHDCHVWGCLLHVLDKHLSDGKKIPHWKPHSKCVIYMGNSPMHASTVPLILNPDTGALSSVFYVVHLRRHLCHFTRKSVVFVHIYVFFLIIPVLIPRKFPVLLLNI